MLLYIFMIKLKYTKDHMHIPIFIISSYIYIENY
jgi:hypothetical protein